MKENGEIGKDGKRVKIYVQQRETQAGYINGVKGVRQVPYKLPDIIKSIERGEFIFITEGEKCADALWALGLPATCNAMGAGKWPDELTPYFKGADIVILPDNDIPGKKACDISTRKAAGYRGQRPRRLAKFLFDLAQ